MPTNRPNILFLHVDQLHYDAMSHRGNIYVETPALDRLASESVVFDRAYSANPVCCPARCSWYTGRMSCEHGILRNSGKLPKDIPDLGQWLRSDGYTCAYTGKWHVTGRNLGKSFDVLDYGGHIGEICDAYVTDSAIAFLEQYDDTDPFFLNVGLLNPHDCCYMGFNPKERHLKQSLTEHFLEQGLLPPLPENFRPGDPKIVRGWEDFDENDFRLYSYNYYRMVEMVDAQVGRLLYALDHSMYSDNTVVVFSSDHGEMNGELGLILKGLTFEASAKVPMFIRPPKTDAIPARTTNALNNGVDVTATLLDYASAAPLPNANYGQSLRPLIESEDAPTRSHTIVEAYHPLQGNGAYQSIIEERYKSDIDLIGERHQFFDLKNDPLEEQNLYGNSEYDSIFAKHREIGEDFFEKMELSETFKQKVSS